MLVKALKINLLQAMGDDSNSLKAGDSSGGLQGDSLSRVGSRDSAKEKRKEYQCYDEDGDLELEEQAMALRAFDSEDDNSMV